MPPVTRAQGARRLVLSTRRRVSAQGLELLGAGGLPGLGGVSQGRRAPGWGLLLPAAFLRALWGS